MNANIDRFFSGPVRRLTETLQDLERRIDPNEEPTSDSLLQELTNCINQVLDECLAVEEEINADDPSQLKEVQARFRDAIWPWFGQCWYMKHALAKPRGYAGDYEMLTSIYDGQVRARGLGGYFDRYFLNTTLARGVVARLALVRNFLLEEISSRSGDVYVLNVASGPCREFFGGFPTPANTETIVTCVDNDELALEFAQNTATRSLPDNVSLKFTRHNALRMTSARSNIARFGYSDIIYSVGLYDYIPDQYLIPLLKGMRESLSAGGVVYVSFKDARLYNKAEYQWLVDWYFFQRTEEECTALFEKAGYDMETMSMTRDTTGVIINYIFHTKAPVEAPVDQPRTIPIAQHLSGIAGVAAALPVSGG
jgi:extracellular factor (EF) 3-hydroxypalmitic acid methyl ester biosynthesis protein